MSDFPNVSSCSFEISDLEEIIRLLPLITMLIYLQVCFYGCIDILSNSPWTLRSIAILCIAIPLMLDTTAISSTPPRIVQWILATFAILLPLVVYEDAVVQKTETLKVVAILYTGRNFVNEVGMIRLQMQHEPLDGILRAAYFLVWLVGLMWFLERDTRTVFGRLIFIMIPVMLWVRLALKTGG